jgi:iron-regulated transporter 1
MTKAARISLAAQNILVVTCSVCVALTFYFRELLVTEGINGMDLTLYYLII